MKVRVPLFGQSAQADLAFPIDLSRPVVFDANGNQLQAFGLPAATAENVSGEGYILDVAKGGSVNCSTLSLSPHGNGTHTECVGHIVTDPVSVNSVVPLVPLIAWVLSVDCESLSETGEGYRGKSAPDDKVISAKALADAAEQDPTFLPGNTALDAIIIRTDFDDKDKAASVPYATDDAIAWLRAHDIHHVVLDVPSLDRLDDGGVLSAHRAFFGLELGQVRLDGHKPRRTVTELARIPDDVIDGPVLLLLEVAPLESDAAPSRPVVFPLEFLTA